MLKQVRLELPAQLYSSFIVSRELWVRNNFRDTLRDFHLQVAYVAVSGSITTRQRYHSLWNNKAFFAPPCRLAYRPCRRNTFNDLPFTPQVSSQWYISRYSLRKRPSAANMQESQDPLHSTGASRGFLQ